MGLLDILGGAKPIAPPAILGETAEGAANDYRQFLQWFTQDIQPYIESVGAEYPGLVDNIRASIGRQRSEYEAQNPWDREFAETGRQLERQTLRELGERGSGKRQNELGMAARERASLLLDNERRASEAQNYGYGRTSPLEYGTTAAQRAATLALAENDARRHERYRGEDARLGALGAVRGAYSEGTINRAAQLRELGALEADVAAKGASGLASVYGAAGDWRNQYIDPAIDTANATATANHQAQQAYRDAKSARTGRILSNVGNLVAAPFTGGATLANLRLGGDAHGGGAVSPFDGAGWGKLMGGGGSSGSGFRLSSLGASAQGGGNIGNFASSRPILRPNMRGGATGDWKPGANRGFLARLG